MSTIKTSDEKLDDILVLLNGNGKIGVCAKVEIVWSVSIFLITAIVLQTIVLIRIMIA